MNRFKNKYLKALKDMNNNSISNNLIDFKKNINKFFNYNLYIK